MWCVTLDGKLGQSKNSWGAGIQHKVKVGMCVQRRFKSVCTSTQSDRSPNFPPEETLDPWIPIECPSKTLIRLCGCAVWSEFLMGSHANLYLLLETGWNLTLKALIMTTADNKFWDIFPNFQKKIRYDNSWESSASRRFSWNIIPYLLFLKKQLNSKLSSAVNYRRHFMG